jgi:hypothetical protein
VSPQPKPKLTPDQELALEVNRYYADPLGYVMFVFPWNTEPSIQQARLPEKYRSRFPNCEYGPDLWACEFLDELGAEIKARGFDGRKFTGAKKTPIQFATASGHGIGKSTLVAWLVKFIFDTRPRSVGTITANTAEQLKGKTWAEVGKWHRLSLTASWGEYVSGRGNMILYSTQKDTRGFPLKESWKCTAQTCRAENSEAFAGQHAAGSTSYYIFDEASAIEDVIFDVREGGTTDGEPMVFDFGNPTRNSGRFFENCVGRFKDDYIFRSIDSRSVQITNKDRIQRWQEIYGEDSDFFRVRVKGQFPKSGNLQFISLADYEAAQLRDTPQLGNIATAVVKIGVDVARYGDDESVIWPRVGDDARSFPPEAHSKLNGPQLAQKVIRIATNFLSYGFQKQNIHIFVDVTGGVGASPYDQLGLLGWNPHPVHFGNRARKEDIYWFRSDEMWGDMRQGIRERLALPRIGSAEEERCRSDLTKREYGLTKKGWIHLETKEDMKDRGLVSPDYADALACTYAEEIAPVGMSQSSDTAPMITRHDYDPHADMTR